MGLDTFELVMDVEDHFGILLREEECQDIRTIGDLAEVVWKRIKATYLVPCPSMVAFYELRTTIREALGVPELRIRPSMVLADLVPLSRRREFWASMRPKQPWRFPGLALSPSMYRWRLTSIFLIWLASIMVLPSEFWILTVSTSAIFSVFVYLLFGRFRNEFPEGYSTVGDLVRTSVGSVIATRKTDLKSKELVQAELLPIIAEQFGVDINKLNSQTRFIEDLGAD